MSDSLIPATQEALANIETVEPDRRGITISAEDMMSSTAPYPEEQRESIRWFYFFTKAENLSLSQSAKELSVSPTTISRAYSGKYEASLDNLAERIARFKELYLQRQSFKTVRFIETSVSRSVWKSCDYARGSQSIVLIYGESQIGKTFALRQWAARNNHGTTKYVRMPASGGVQLMMKEIARACCVSPKSCFEELRDRVFRAIDDKTTVIVDEVHQVFLSYQKGSAIKCLEVLREIYDRSECGMVLCGTNVWQEELNNGELKAMLSQLRRRGAVERQLPDILPARDIKAVAAEFKLPPPTPEAEETVRYTLKEWGIGRFIKYLQAADNMALKEKTKLTWAHFIRAHDILARIRQKDQSDSDQN